jgi:hypothetical protein
LADGDGRGEVPPVEGWRMGVEGGGGLGQFGGCCSWEGACAGCSWFEADVVILRPSETWLNVAQFQGYGRQQFNLTLALVETVTSTASPWRPLPHYYT